MHQIPQIGRIVYATNLNLEHLWNFKLDQQGTYIEIELLNSVLFLVGMHSSEKRGLHST